MLKEKRQPWLSLLLFLALLLLLPPLLQQISLDRNHSRYPRLVASYLGRTNVLGQQIVRIGVTNVGSVTVVRLSYYNLYWRNTKTAISGGIRIGAHRLLPGQGDVIEVVAPPAVEAPPWQITFCYARAGLGTRLYEWQRDSVPPGSWIRHLIPEYFAKPPVPFEATTGWIEE